MIDEKEREIEKIKQETWLKEQKIEQEIRLKKQKLKQDLQKETNKNSKSQKKKHNKKMIKPLRIDQWKLAKVAKFKIYSYKQEIKKLQFREKARQKFREMRETISN